MKKILALIVYYLVVLSIIWCVLAGIKSTYKFDPEDVRPQLERVLGTSDYTVIEQSNNSIWTGTPSDVTYNIMLADSTVVSCRCTDNLFQPRICRKYQ